MTDKKRTAFEPFISGLTVRYPDQGYNLGTYTSLSPDCFTLIERPDGAGYALYRHSRYQIPHSDDNLVAELTLVQMQALFKLFALVNLNDGIPQSSGDNQ